jgi:hypothetical protein
MWLRKTEIILKNYDLIQLEDHPFKMSALFRGGGGRGVLIADVCQRDGGRGLK